MNETWTNRATLTMLLGCALAITPLLAPEARAQGPSPDVEALHFVGTHSGTLPQEALTYEELQFLIACRRPATLGEVLAQGVAFQASRIERLQAAGLLVQSGQRFEATFPIWLEGDSDAVDALDELAEPIVAALVPAFRRLLSRLEEAGHPEAMPALASWIVYERAWDYLVSSGMIDLRGLIERRQHSYPNRDWWGALWYHAEQAEPLQQLTTTRTNRDHTVLFAWAPGAAPEELDPENPYPWLARLLGAVRNDRLELRDPERFEDLVQAGIVGPDERLNAPLFEWDPDEEDSLAVAVTETVELVAVTTTGQLTDSWVPAGKLQQEDPAVRQTIAYHGLAPRILAGLTAAGIRSLVDVDSPRTRTIVRVTDDGDSVEVRPRNLSLFFWKDLPREMQRPSVPLR